jgi:hypothetical protein
MCNAKCPLFTICPQTLIGRARIRDRGSVWRIIVEGTSGIWTSMNECILNWCVSGEEKSVCCDRHRPSKFMITSFSFKCIAILKPTFWRCRVQNGLKQGYARWFWGSHGPGSKQFCPLGPNTAYVKIKLFLCLVKHHVMKTCWGMGV